MKSQKLLLIFIGAPGSGKGTQAAEAAKKYEIPHLSTGDLLRDEIKKKSSIGLQAKNYIESGQLVPDTLIIEIIKGHIAKAEKGILLDGFPRTLEQAKILEELVQGKFRTVILHLDTSDKTVIERITGRKSCSNCSAIYHTLYKPSKKEGICDLCQSLLVTRSDDNEATVRTRVETFHKQTDPVIEFYTKNGNLYTIDGEKSSEEVQKACSTIIETAVAAL